MKGWCEYRLKEGLPTLLLPPDATPENYEWPVRGLEVLAIQCGEYPVEEIPRLAFRLLKAGANVVRVAGNAPSFAVFYRQRRAA